MSSDAPKLGTGLFGYRRSTVEQIMAESEARLREAEARLQAAESRVSELQRELATLKRRNAQMGQQTQRFGSEEGEGPGRALSPEPVRSPGSREHWSRTE